MGETIRALAPCILGVILLVCVVGCDDNDHVDVVDFAVSCSTVACFDVDETGSFFADDGTEHLFCTWFCADYDGFRGIFVELTFERAPDGCFVLASEFIADGIC